MRVEKDIKYPRTGVHGLTKIHPTKDNSKQLGSNVSKVWILMPLWLKIVYLLTETLGWIPSYPGKWTSCMVQTFCLMFLSFAIKLISQSIQFGTRLCVYTWQVSSFLISFRNPPGISPIIGKSHDSLQNHPWKSPSAPPPPTPIEPGGGGGTYAHSPSPKPPYLGYWLPLAITKNTPFSGLSREIFPRLLPKNTPLSRENGNTHEAPSCIRVGGGGGNPHPCPGLAGSVSVTLLSIKLID